MKTPMIATSLLLAAASLQACVITTDDDSSFTVDNYSDYAIYEVYLAERDDPSWGPDLLGGDILYPGESLEIRYVDCGLYDALIYDELGAECELQDIDLCFDDARWIIDNALLSTCPIFN